MAIQYDLYENPPKSAGKNKGYYARLVSEKTVTTEELAKKACAGTTLSPELIKLALSRVVDMIKISMAQGCRIHVEDLGFFSPSLSITYSDDKRRTQPIVKANDVNFTPEADVKRYLATIQTIHAVSAHRTLKQIGNEELDGLLRKHFETSTTLTRSQFQRLIPSLSRNACCSYLNECVELEKLWKVGASNAPIYMKKNL